MTIEQRLAEIIGAFCADALSSTVNLNVDLDVVLCVLAQALLAAFRNRLGPGYATAAPDTLQRRFLDTAGTITHHGDTITVTLNRRAYSPVLRQSDLRTDTTIPWWQRPPPPLPAQLAGGTIRCMEIRATCCALSGSARSQKTDRTFMCKLWTPRPPRAEPAGRPGRAGSARLG